MNDQQPYEDEPELALSTATESEQHEIASVETTLVRSSAPPAHSPASAAVDDWLGRAGTRPSFFPKDEPKSARLVALEKLLPSSHPPARNSDPAALSGRMLAAAPSQPPQPYHTTLTPHAIPDNDEGAAIALGTVRRRAPAPGQGFWGLAPASPSMRSLLLTELAGTHQGRTRSHLLSAASEMNEALGHSTAARALRERAHLAEPSEIVSLRRLRQDAMLAGDHPRTAALLEQELQLALPEEERALSTLALAELHQGVLDQPADAEAAAGQLTSKSPESQIAGLIAARQRRKRGDLRGAAELLRRVAGHWPKTPERAALRLLSSHAFRSAGDAGRALEQAEAPGPSDGAAQAGRGSDVSANLLIERHRSAHACGDRDAARRALSELADRLRTRPAKAAARRMLSLLQREQLGDTSLATATLDGAAEAADLRMRAMRSIEAGQDAIGAIGDWVEAASGTDKALALCELALAHAAADRLEEAQAALLLARQTSPSLSWAQLCREVLARRVGDAQDVAEAVGAAGQDEALAAAAKLARAGADDERERGWLVRAQLSGTDAATTEAILLDLALSGDDRGKRDELLEAWSRQLGGRNQLGALLLLSQRPTTEESLAALGAHASQFDASPAWNASRLATSDDPAYRVDCYRDEAEVSEGAWATTCWLLAAGVHGWSGHDPGALLEAALGVAQMPVAIWQLQQHLATQRDGAAQSDLEEARMTTAVGPVQRAVQAIKASLWSDDGAHARSLLQIAKTDCPGDLVLAELLLKGAETSSAEDRVTELECALSQRSDAMRRVARLRAARTLEGSGDLDAAAERYRKVLAQHPQDLLASSGLSRVLALDENPEALVTYLDELALSAAEPAQTMAHHYSSAMVLARQADSRATGRLEVMLRRAHNHVPVLRALERAYLEADHREGLARITGLLASTLGNATDRTAYLHAHTRLLSSDGTQEQLDGVIVEAAEHADRQALWYALRLEDAARRTGDRELTNRATGDVSRIVTSTRGRASYALRAAEAIEPISNAHAAAALSNAAEAAPDHPVLTEELARLYQRTGELEAAARNFARAAEAATSKRRAVRLWNAAAAIYQDELGRLDLARRALGKALELDPSDRSAFDRMRQLLEHTSDRDGTIALLRRRLSAEEDPERAAELTMSLYETVLGVEPTDSALAILQQGVQRCPTNVPLLSTLGHALFEAGRYKEATEPLIQLARLVDDPEELFRAFRILGIIYHDHLVDLRRAEIAFSRCLNVADDDPEIIERIVEIYERGGQLQRAARALQRLAEICHDEAACERHTLRLVDMLVDLDHPELAEQMLEELRRKQPTKLLTLRAMSQFYQRRGDARALMMHLGRAAHGFRMQIERDPALAEHWHGLLEVALLREQRRGAALVASVATAAGIGGPPVTALEDQVQALGPRVRAPSVRAALRPRPLGGAAFTFVQELSKLLRSLYPTRPEVRKAPRLRDNEVWFDAAAAAASDLGIVTPELHACKARAVVSMGARKPVLLISQDLLHTTSLEQARVLCTRALVLWVERVAPAALLTPSQFTAVLDALSHRVDPNFHIAPERNAAAQAVLSELPAHLTRKRQRELGKLLFDAVADGPLDAAALHHALWQFGSRAALVASGNGPAALGALLHLAGAPALRGNAISRSAAIVRSPEVHALLSFALSEELLSLLSVATTTQPREAATGKRPKGARRDTARKRTPKGRRT